MTTQLPACPPGGSPLWWPGIGNSRRLKHLQALGRHAERHRGWTSRTRNRIDGGAQVTNNKVIALPGVVPVETLGFGRCRTVGPTTDSHLIVTPQVRHTSHYFFQRTSGAHSKPSPAGPVWRHTPIECKARCQHNAFRARTPADNPFGLRRNLRKCLEIGGGRCRDRSFSLAERDYARVAVEIFENVHSRESTYEFDPESNSKTYRPVPGSELAAHLPDRPARGCLDPCHLSSRSARLNRANRLAPSSTRPATAPQLSAFRGSERLWASL